MTDVAILGAGYVGVCTGVTLASRGHRVTLVDVDKERVEAIRNGTPPFHEPGLAQALKEVVADGRLTATLDDASAVRGAQVTFLCVGTPQAADGSADLTYIEKAARDVGRALRDGPGYHVVVTKSTVPPGTARSVVGPAVAEASGGQPGRAFDVASNPEFLREGAALEDARNPDRIVVGAPSERAAQRIWSLYEDHDCPKLTVTPTTAEMIKYAANAFLAVRVGLSNELANVCERVGVDWTDVAEGIGLDDRIGPRFLRAGVGFGGSCFPKDVAAIAHIAHERETPSLILDATLEGNRRQPLVAVRMLEEELGDLAGKRIALLGLAFKPNTSDVRETRAVPIYQALVSAGARVVCHDPAARETFRQLVPDAPTAEAATEALEGAHGAIVQTAWPAYAELEPAVFLQHMAEPVVVDGRRALDHEAMRQAGIRYRAIGLGRP